MSRRLINPIPRSSMWCLREFRRRPDDHVVATPPHLDGVVGHEPVAADDEVERTLALPDAALTGDEDAEAEDVQQHAVDQLAGRQPVLEHRDEPVDGHRRGDGRAQDGHARAVTFGHEVRGRLEAARDQHARNVVAQHAPEGVASRVRRQRLQEADLALAEHQDAPALQVGVEPGERQAGLLNAGRQDRPAEPRPAPEDFHGEQLGVLRPRVRRAGAPPR